ncbi:OmpA family protein [Roseovarius sp. 2305UL8-3]|uniref:OmpA family protein n=1 Tax=Roseovarius conchicola TaxID=3121636 RepID=UPI003529C67D
MRARLCALILLLCPAMGQALDLSLPGNATLTREVIKEAESYQLPIAPFSEGALPTLEIEGRFVQQAWRLEAQAITTLQMLTPVRAQLLEEGYDILLDCVGHECGGFDFRFATRVLPAPDMFVDLFDYRFLSARRGVDGTPDYISVLVSRSGATGHIQVIQLAPEGAEQIQVEADLQGFETVQRPASDLPVAQALLQHGHVILPGLQFKSGSSDLDEGGDAALEELATFLKSNATMRVALVGHTDTVGGLDANIALSKRRAGSVLEKLVSDYGVPRSQLDAEGMGYLSPIAPNLSQEGREINRRVEAVLLNSE